MKKIIIILTVALLFLLPWQTRLIILPGMINGGYSEYGTISLYGTEILLWLIVVLLIVQYFLSRLSSPYKGEARRGFSAPGAGQRFKIFAFLFFCFLAFSLAHPTLMTLNCARLWLEGILIFLIIRGAGERTKLFWAFVAGAVLQACLGIWQFFTQSAFASKWLGMAAHDPATLGTYVVEAAGGRWLRAYGALPHPNILSGYLVAAILLTIFFLPLIKSNQNLPLLRRGGAGGLKECILSYFILPILFAGLFFTFSRGSWIALIIGLLILYVTQIKSLKSSSLVIGLWTSFVVVACLAILFWPLVLTRTVADSRLEIKSSSERMSYYSEAWILIKRHPFLGVGLGNYTRAVHDEINNARPAYAYQPVHNIFVLALAELGALGLLIIAAAIFILRKVISWKKIIYLALLLVIGLFDHYLWTLYFGIILVFVYTGLIFDQKSLTRDTDLS